MKVNVKNIDKYIYWLFFILISILPLITKTKKFNFISPIFTGTELDSGMKSNVYTYYKFLFLIIITIISVFMFYTKVILNKYQIQKSYINIPLVILLMVILFSGINSRYISIAMIGNWDILEGTITYLCYFILFFIAANITYSEKRLRYLMYALYPAVIINAVLSLTYFLGYDLLQNQVIHNLIFGPTIAFSADEAGGAFASTMFNPNYASGFGTVTFLIFITQSLLEKERKVKVVSIVFAILSFLIVVTSQSLSGYIAIVLLLPLLIFFLCKKTNKKRETITLILISLFCISLYFGLNSIENLFASKNNSLIQSTENKGSESSPKINKKLVEKVGSKFNLPNGGVAPLSGRVYIWQKTWELIKQKPLFGYGLNTFGYFYSQDDISKYANLGDYENVLDKPHSMYLDIAFGSGLLALVPFSLLLIKHFYKGITLFRNKIDSEYKILLAALFISWCGYLIQGVVNDSTICSAPIFWVLFGASVSIINQEQGNA